MDHNYNPFGQQVYVETQYGIINRVERRYFTHRRKEHYFKKYQGFAISETELGIAWKLGVVDIIIKYYGEKKNTLYKSSIRDWLYGERYDNQGDKQRVINIKQMKIAGYEVSE